MNNYVVVPAAKLSSGDRVVVSLKGREIAVFNIDGEYYAYPNWCPHQGGPLCEGSVDGTTEENFDRETLTSDLHWIKDGEILQCPWHNWEFDLTENCFMHDADRSLPSYPVRVEDGNVIVSL